MSGSGHGGFVLESTWRPVEGGESGSYEIRLSNQTGEALRHFSIGISGPIRISGDAVPQGGSVGRQLSNYAELAPPAGFELMPGETWTIVIDKLDYPIRHWTDGVVAGFIIRDDGFTVTARTRPVRSAASDAPRLRGTTDLPVPTDPSVSLSVIPWPRDVQVSGRRTVPAGFALPDTEPAAAAFTRLTTLLFPGEGIVRDVAQGGLPVHLRREDGHAPEAYVIDFAASEVTVTATTQTGLLYGLITLGQIQRGARLALSAFSFPIAGRIADAPRMGWRGCHLDVARRFYAPAEVERFLAVLAWNKLNVLHWHLSDDEAWRVEIDAYPQLTETGAWQGYGLTMPPLLGAGPERSGGVYSKDTVREIVGWAAEIGIDVVPEIDVPGHCYALLQALPELRDPHDTGSARSIQSFPNNSLNPAVEAVYPALETIFAELLDLFPSRYFHVGADEVPPRAWDGSPLATALGERLGAAGTAPLQAHFLRRIQKFLTANGRITGAWEEAAEGGGVDRENSYLVGWQDMEVSQRLAAEGYAVVVAPGQSYYLDMANGPEWHEPGAGWAGWSSPEKAYGFEPAAGWSEAEQARLMGVQACIWSEPMTDRGVFDRLVFPRLSAIAETGWIDPARKDFDRFSALAGLMPNLYGVGEQEVPQ